ncbi:MAG: hypothetical protein GYA51_17565 [Candidatus Methanofastidiosa archaeon]|nr:hypothetical protein [Candidatus Methanofastidiosa archaeon]
MEYGQKIGFEVDKTKLQKALGVLREDGVYAMFLWIEDKDKDKDKKTREKLMKLLNEESIKKYLNSSQNFPNNFKEFCEKLKDVVKDIDKLLFLKKILERTLTYALYHAKVKGDKNVEKT